MDCVLADAQWRWGRPLNVGVMRLPKFRQATLAAAAIVLAGCSWNRSQDVASRTLLDERGYIDKLAYSAALSAKFPPGTELKKLERYVADFNGTCHPRDGRTWCDFGYRGGFCWAAMVGIWIVEKDGLIQSMTVEVGGLGC
jgi:hypothetical protein